MSLLIVGLFMAALLICIVFQLQTLYALAFGFFLFTGYARYCGIGWKKLVSLCLKGVKTLSNVVILFIFIGTLTGIWRDCGTVATIVCWAGGFIRPATALLMTYLLNVLVSFITGTAFGTAATMGVVCATICGALGIHPALMGGAVLSGAYWGDRCSPVSSAAALTAGLTGTKTYENIPLMLRSAWAPTLLSAVIYAVIGYFSAGSGEVPDIAPIFESEFRLHILAVIPAVLVVGLALLKVNARLSMAVSIVSAIPLSFFLQKHSAGQVVHSLILGFTAEGAELGTMMNGGGMVSMAKAALIVLITGTYTELFRETKLIDGFQSAVERLAGKIGSAAAITVTAALSSLIACNQTFTIILTRQLCEGIEPDNKKLMLSLENTAELWPAVVPWCLACAVTVSAVGAPDSAALFAFFCWLTPLWYGTVSYLRYRKDGKPASNPQGE